jgi:hypothetical protein
MFVMKYVAIAALLLALCPPALAQERQTPGSRIQVEVCHPHRHTAAEAHPWIDPFGVWHYGRVDFPWWDGFLQVTYRNQAGVAASEVDFGLVARGSLVAVAKDVGTFSPGVRIDHEFVISREVFPLGTEFPYCAVLRVRYSDGSVWTNPNPPQP